MKTSKGNLTKVGCVYVLETKYGVRYTALYNASGKLVGLDQYDNEYRLSPFVRRMFELAIKETNLKNN